jgi:hypothetical protein
MTIKIKDHFKWLNVPLDIESEISDVNGDWYKLNPIKI